MNECEAFGFRSPLGLKEMLSRLKSCGLSWHLGDSDSLGEYLVCRPFADLTRLRIAQQDDGYVVDLYFHSDSPEAKKAWVGLRRRVLDSILPLIEAQGIEAASTLD